MAIDHVDRAMSSRRHPSLVGQVGQSVGRIAHGASALIRHVVVFALGLIESIIAALPRVLRSVVRTAKGLVTLVADVGLRIAHGAVGLLRRAPA